MPKNLHQKDGRANYSKPYNKGDGNIRHENLASGTLPVSLFLRCKHPPTTGTGKRLGTFQENAAFAHPVFDNRTKAKPFAIS
ncbi:hypothetical protein QQP08_026208 [Theobroma cacao]|nr:hypothetical protein QQP08_026208 [Theobroma cacao]